MAVLCSHLLLELVLLHLLLILTILRELNVDELLDVARLLASLSSHIWIVRLISEALRGVWIVVTINVLLVIAEKLLFSILVRILL